MMNYSRNERRPVRAIFRLFLLCLAMRTVASKKTPEASSTLLQMHRLYLQQPPHDRTLYDTLHVSPNATAAVITKAYRRLSRRYHPDKRAGVHTTNNDDESDELLRKVQEAYEILKDDATRLPYHRYGLVEPTQAVLVLTGKGHGNDPELEELIRLMGYHRAGEHLSDRERILLLATDLVEKLRPVVEGRISEHSFFNYIAADCDRLKRLPLGAQIIRCIGRAYKHAGQRYLRLQKNNNVVPEGLRDGWRQSKLFLTAAGWWGRAVLTESMARSSIAAAASKKTKATITYHGWKDEFGDPIVPKDRDIDEEAPSHDDISERERIKAQKAIIESTQVEALWKICKIDLYRTIREACDLMFSGEYFFFPVAKGGEGWIGSKGHAIDTSLGLFRAATTLATMGDVMVERSKDGTAWME